MQHYGSLSNHSKISTKPNRIKKLDSRFVHYPARYAARLSQAFTNAVSVKVEEILLIEDSSMAHNSKFHFTDGVGTLSPEFRVLDQIEVD